MPPTLHPLSNMRTPAFILISIMVSLVACDAENNPTTMKGRTITPASLPKIHTMTLPKLPDSVREQLSGIPGRTPAPEAAASLPFTQGGPKDHATTPTTTHDPTTTSLPS